MMYNKEMLTLLEKLMMGNRDCISYVKTSEDQE